MQTLPALLSQVISQLSVPPGSLVYDLVLLFAFQAAAAIAFGQWQKGGAEARLFWAAAGLFVVRLILLVVALFEAAAQTPSFGALLSPSALPRLLAIIPPLDRTGSALTILLIVSAFAFPKPSRLVDALVGALALLCLLALGIGWILWMQEIPPIGTALAFNGSAQESVWEIVQLVFLVMGTILVAVRRGPAWFGGIVLLFLLLAAHFVQLILPLSGNVPGLIRLVEIVALPMFTALVYLNVHAPLAPPTPVLPPLQLPASTVLSPSAVNARGLVALASLHAASDVDQRRQNLTLALGYLFQADLSLLILPPDKKGAAPVACSYRVSRGQFTSRPDLFLRAFPAVAATLRGGGPMLLTAAEHDVELRRLAADTGLEGVGFGLLAPLALSADYPVGAVALLASAARPAWTAEDLELLGALARSLAAVFDTADQIAALRHESQSQQSRADAAEEQRRVVQETAEKLMGELAQAQTVILQLTAQLNQAQTGVQSHAPGGLDLAEAERRRRDEERNRLEVELEAAQEGLTALALLQNQFKSLAEEAEGLRLAKAELEKEAEQLRSDLHSTEAQLHVFATSDHALESEAQSKQTAQLRLELELARMELKVAADRQAVQAQQAEQDKQTQAQADLAAAQAELEEARSWMQQLSAEQDRARTQLRTAIVEKEQLQANTSAQMAGLTAEVERLRAERQPAVEGSDTLMGGQAAQAAAEIASLAAALELARAERQQAVERAEALAGVQAELAEGQRRETEAAAQAADLTAELERVRAEHQQAVERAEALAGVQAEMAERQQREIEAAAQVANLTAELERVRAEHQQVAERAEALAGAQAALAEALADKETSLRELADQQQQREAELMAQAAERTMEWECLQADLREAQTALAEKTLSLQQQAEQAQLQNSEWMAQVEQGRAELQQAMERAAALEQEVQRQAVRLGETQAALAAAQAALAEETLNGENLTRQHKQRDTEWAAQMAGRTGELERAHAERQQALEQSTALAAQVAALERAEQCQKVLAQEAQAALASAHSALADRMEQLNQVTGAHQQQETEWTAALEQARAELQGARERLSALEKSEEDQQAQLKVMHAALGTARTAIAGQAAAFVSTQEKLAEKERELAEALANLQTARQAEMPPTAQTTLERIATLAQDLRQPIMSISGYVSLLLGESVGLVGAVQKKFLERIQAACERLEVLLNDLSQASEAAFGSRPLTMASVSVTRLVEEALQGSEALLREKGIHLRLELAENVPTLQADAAALRRVFSGLIHNAASATPLNGEVRLTVRRETQTSKEDGRTECIFVLVKDSGSGLSPEDLPKVFSTVTRLETPLAGLGDGGRELAALQPLVEAHRGRIWVTSEPGQGSLFAVMLPVTDAPPCAAETDLSGEAVDPPLPVPKALDFLVLPPDR